MTGIMILATVAFLHCAQAAVLINVTQTAQGTSDRLSPQAPIAFQPRQVSAPSAQATDTRISSSSSIGGAGGGVANATLTVDRTKLFQTIEGFGGAFTGSSSHLFARLNASQQERLLALYFDPEEGLGYTMGRYTIGSCDFALGYYNYAGVKGDTDLAHFNFSHDDAEIVPFVQRAQARAHKRLQGQGGKLKLVASPWSAPPWMKKNNHMNCDLGPLSCELKTDSDTRRAWALYFSKFIAAMSERGLGVWGVTVQNEPEAQTGNIVYEGMHYTPELERDFVRDYLGPRLREDHPGVNLLIYDHNKDHIVKWAQAILGDNETAQYVWGTAFHWYTGPYFENLEQTHALFPAFKLLSTESTVAKQKPHTYDTPSWADGEQYGAEIIGDLQHWSTGFIDWNLLLDDFGGPSHADPTGHLCEGLIKCGSDAMIIVDQQSELQLQAFYYYMGHVSKFVPPGSRRIGLTNSTDAITATAMLTPANETVVVAMNAQDSPVQLTLVDADLGTANTMLLPHSIVTLVYRHDE